MDKTILWFTSDDFYSAMIKSFEILSMPLKFKTVSTMTDAIDSVRSGQVALIVLDFDADRSSALEFARTMQDESDYKGIPILAITKHGKSNQEVFGAGCGAVLKKPFKVKELTAIIEKYLPKSC